MFAMMAHNVQMLSEYKLSQIKKSQTPKYKGLVTSVHQDAFPQRGTADLGSYERKRMKARARLTEISRPAIGPYIYNKVEHKPLYI